MKVGAISKEEKNPEGKVEARKAVYACANTVLQLLTKWAAVAKTRWSKSVRRNFKKK